MAVACSTLLIVGHVSVLATLLKQKELLLELGRSKFHQVEILKLEIVLEVEVSS